jgi:hypothetical protein
MTTNQHPITPPPELVQLLRNEAPQGIRDAGVTRELFLITAAYRAGADAELEACCKWLPKLPPWSADDLRKHRRPKPPSLKEQALAALSEADQGLNKSEWQQCSNTIRRALEQLDD